LLDINKITQITAEDVKIDDNDKLINETFDGLMTEDDQCSISKIQIENNADNIKNVTTKMDDNYVLDI
jgi:hypothetical protein